MSISKPTWPYKALLIEILLCYRKVLFRPAKYAIPWDLQFYHLPLAEFMAKSFREGHLPLWDPFTYCGWPIYAELTTQVFYPPTILAVLASNLAGGRHLLYFIELQLIAHVLLAGVFAYLLLRRLGAGAVAASIGASVYQLGPFFASQAQHLGAIDAAAWLPLSWMAIVDLSERFTWRGVGLLALSLSMAILSGFPAVTAVVFVTCFLLACALLSWRSVVGLAAGSLWAIALAAIQVLPTAELSSLSVAKYRSDWSGDGGGHPLQALYSLVIPELLGHFPVRGRQLQAALESNVSVPLRRTYRIGVRDRRDVLVEEPIRAVFPRAHRGLPVVDAGPKHAGRAHDFPLASENREGASLRRVRAAGVCAGDGDARRSWAPSDCCRAGDSAIQSAAVAACAIDLIAVGSSRPMNTTSFDNEPGIAYDHYDGIKEIPVKMRELVNQTFPPSRIDTMNGSINWAGAADLFEVPTASGNDPMAPERVTQARMLFQPGRQMDALPRDPGARFSVRRSDERAIRCLEHSDCAGTTRKGALPGGRRAARKFRLRKHGSAAALLPGDAHSKSGRNGGGRRADAIAGFQLPRRGRGGRRCRGRAGAVQGAVRTLRYDSLEAQLEVESPTPAYLVTSETNYPGWRAYVDGNPQPIFTTNVAFRGLAVPAGRHIVTMRFRPAILWRGAALSFVSWAGLAALLLRHWISLRRSSLPPTSSV